MKLLFVYITTKDRDEARAIAGAVVEEHLAACANIVDGMNSFHFWDGSLCDDQEAVLFLKTKESLLERLVDRIKEIHSYEVPCIVALPIEGGNGEYLEWVEKECGRGGR